MCFLKTLKPLQTMSFEKEAASDDSSHQQSSKVTQGENSYMNKLFTSAPLQFLSKQDGLLLQLMNLVQSNNSRLQALDQKLSQNQERLAQTHLNIDQMMGESFHLPSFADQSMTSISSGCSEQEGSVVDPLITQLFGKKKYHYKLQLQGEVPSVIYKERNINVSVNLIGQESQKIMNSNIVHLCLGVCDANGQWITENRAGQNFMKGKTEMEMYHGEGSFLKVYPRDVSRSYPEGKINFVIYSKPSLVQFSNSSSGVERIVESSLIEPLLIKDISIRAKKKE